MSPALPRSDRLAFRWWKLADLELAEGLWGDPEVTRFVGGPFPKEEVRRRLEQEMANGTSLGIQYWPMFLLAGGDFAGCCGLRPQKRNEPAEDIFELGFYLRKAHWGKGYASEAARAVIEHAFQTLGANALFAGHHPENENSKRVLEKLGFRYVHHGYYAPTGLMHPTYLLNRTP